MGHFKLELNTLSPSPSWASFLTVIDQEVEILNGTYSSSNIYFLGQKLLNKWNDWSKDRPINKQIRPEIITEPDQIKIIDEAKGRTMAIIKPLTNV